MLRAQFSDGTRHTIYFEPVLRGPISGSLRNLALSNQVKLPKYAGCLELPTGAGFDPEILRD
ncbi:MAG: hypothetical protein H3C34_08245 [Caldilineaceae bacterium]|nr:hypothetical protein [Caldilineaceae bacterium]